VSVEKETTIRPSLFLLAVHHSLFARRTCGADANIAGDALTPFEPQSTGGSLVAIPNAAVVMSATMATPERQTRISKRSGFIEVLPRRDGE
jgi:hypothetical protein